MLQVIAYACAKSISPTPVRVLDIQVMVLSRYVVLIDCQGVVVWEEVVGDVWRRHDKVKPQYRL